MTRMILTVLAFFGFAILGGFVTGIAYDHYNPAPKPFLVFDSPAEMQLQTDEFIARAARRAYWMVRGGIVVGILGATAVFLRVKEDYEPRPRPPDDLKVGLPTSLK